MARIVDADFMLKDLTRLCKRISQNNGCRACPLFDAEDDMCMVEDFIHSQPDIEVKHAHWIPKQLGDCECSNCHEEYSVCGGLLGDYNFCPNCGADMRGE